VKQPHRHTGAPGALIVSITHEPTRGERAPRDCQVFRSRSPDSGQPEPLQIHSESTGRAVFPQLPPLGPAEEQKPLAFKRESPSPPLSPCGISPVLYERCPPTGQSRRGGTNLRGPEEYACLPVLQASMSHLGLPLRDPPGLGSWVGSRRLASGTSGLVVPGHRLQSRTDAVQIVTRGITPRASDRGADLAG
jgi:hypothetical protein